VTDSNENKKTVLAFYNLAFNDRQPVEAVAQYIGATYRQHNPKAQDGPVGFVQYVSGILGQFPDALREIKRTVAEDDLVVIHSLVKGAPFGPWHRHGPTSSAWRTGRSSSTGTCTRSCRRLPRTTTPCSDQAAWVWTTRPEVSEAILRYRVRPQAGPRILGTPGMARMRRRQMRPM